VLYPSVLRDLLIRIAQAGLVQAEWTDAILDEAFRSLRANLPISPRAPGLAQSHLAVGAGCSQLGLDPTPHGERSTELAC
jgi:hypothetical protein